MYLITLLVSENQLLSRLAQSQFQSAAKEKKMVFNHFTIFFSITKLKPLVHHAKG